MRGVAVIPAFHEDGEHGNGDVGIHGEGPNVKTGVIERCGVDVSAFDK